MNINKNKNNKIYLICILTDLSITYQYLGCFVYENAMLLNKNFELINTNTPRICSEICYNAMYQFAGVIGQVMCTCIIYFYDFIIQVLSTVENSYFYCQLF